MILLLIIAGLIIMYSKTKFNQESARLEKYVLELIKERLTDLMTDLGRVKESLAAGFTWSQCLESQKMVSGIISVYLADCKALSQKFMKH